MDDPDYPLRPATPSDVAAITRCVQAAYAHYIERIGKPPRPMLEDYAEIIRHHQVFVAEQDGEVAGVLVLGETPAGLRVMNVAVFPNVQRMGIGAALLRLAESEARRRGLASIYLSTHAKMTENQAMYAKIGYREYDRREEEGYSRVYMRKSLV